MHVYNQCRCRFHEILYLNDAVLCDGNHFFFNETLSVGNSVFCSLEIPESDMVPGTILVTEEELSRCIEDVFKVGNLSH